MEASAGMARVRRLIPRGVRMHPFVSVLIVAALIGGALRFIPTGTAASSSGSTACAAK